MSRQQIYQEQGYQFKQRIKQSLSLFQDLHLQLYHLKNIALWTQNNINKFKSNDNNKQKEHGLMDNWLRSQKNTQKDKNASNLKNLESLKQHLINGLIPQQFKIESSIIVPDNIKCSINLIKGKQIKMQKYYGRVKGPYLSNLLIRKKEDLNKNIQKVNTNGLKLIVIQQNVSDKYQRNLVQELFGRVFRHVGFFSVVIKIQIEKNLFENPSTLFIYIQDISFRQKQVWMSIDEVKEGLINNKQAIYVQKDGKKIKVNDKNLLETFLSEMFVIPLQTLIPQFIVFIKQGQAFLVKHHDLDQQKASQQTSQLKSHPSIRNPLLFFKNLIQNYQFNIDAVKQIVVNKDLFGGFYQSLNGLMVLICQDFSFQRHRQSFRAVSFTSRTFKSLWNTFHSIQLLSDWLEEVVRPVRDYVTLSQIIERFCPISNYISTFNAVDVKAYRNLINNLQIQTYMTTYIPKSAIKHYNSLFIGFNQLCTKAYQSADMVFKQIFLPTLGELDLQSYNINQVPYIFSFVSRYQQPQRDINMLPKSWSDRRLWKKIYRNIEQNQFQNIDFYLDIMGYYIGIQTQLISNRPFQHIRYIKQSEQFIKNLKSFILMLKTKYEKNYQSLYSIILQKCLKYNKLDSAMLMLDNQAKITDYSQIFQQEILSQKVQKKRVQFIKKIKEKGPQMYRRYQWQHLMRVELKFSKEGYQSINTIDFQKCWFKKEIYDSIFNEDCQALPFNVSRKDYMYGTKDITKIVLREGVEYYIEKSQYPMVPKFYKTALNLLGISHIIPNYTLFMHQKGVFRISQCIQGASTFQRSLQNYEEKDIKYFLNDNLLSQGIIISMLFLPEKLTLKDLIMKPSFTQTSLFVINFKEFYQRSPIIKQGDQFILKCKNCFFLMDVMHKTITSSIMKKYTEIDINHYINQLFNELSQVNKQMIKLKKQQNFGNQNKQLLGMIFQKQFIIQMCKRFYKIQTCFRNSLKNNTMISHMELLDLICPQLSYFYEQIISSSNQLRQRQKLLFDQMWTKPFVKKQSLFEFIASSSNASQPTNLFPQHFKKFCFCGPAQSLAVFNENRIKFKVFQDNFLQTKWNLQTAQTVQFYIEHFQLKHTTKQQKDAFFEKAKQKSIQYLKQKSNSLPLKYIKIHSIQLLKQNTNILQSFSYERVHELCFQNCKFSSQFISTLIDKISNVNYLCFKKIDSIDYIGSTSFQTSSLQFKNVKILIIRQCQNLNYIDIKCDILETLVIRDNKLLQNIYINSNNLKTMNCTLNPNLNLQNIGVYILRGVNVLLCKTTSFGDAKKLYDPVYDIYLVKILKFMLNRLEDHEAKNNIFITLAKLNYFKQSLSAQFSSTGLFNTISNFVLKFNPKLEDGMLITLFEIFLRNPFIESLYFNYISSISNKNILSFFDKALSKIGKTKPFKQLYLHSLDFPGMKQSIQIFKKFNFQKNFLVSVSNLTDKQFQDKAQLLKNFMFTHPSIEKLTANLKDSPISTELFNALFNRKDAESNPNSKSKLTKASLQDCQILAQVSNISHATHFKQLSLKNCTIKNILILKSLSLLKYLKMERTQIQSPMQHFYETLQSFKELQVFHFIQQKQKLNKIAMSQLFKSLETLKKLQQIDLSKNQFTIQDVKLLNKFLSIQNSNLQRLILENFYSISEKQRQLIFTDFLKDSLIKILKIQIKYPQQFKILIQQISKNKKLVKIELITRFSLLSTLLQPLNHNKTLQQIKSNQLLPMWLKNHVHNTCKSKSKFIQQSQQIMIPIKTSDHFKVGLSLDGGGTRGILIAAQINYLQKQIGQPMHKIFDYVGGTSIGGILTLGCTGTLDGYHPICYAKDLVQVFDTYGNVIFPKSQIRNIVNIFDTKYSPSGIQSVLKNILKDAKLSDVLQQTNAVVTAVSRVDNKDVIFKSMDALLHRDKDYYMRDVGRATSAAPTYFPSAQIKNIDATVKLSLMDGGVGLNNPSKLVLDQLKKMAFNYGYENNYFLLSMGTGKLQTDVIPQKAGYVNVAGIIDSFGQSANYFLERDLQDNYKGHFLRVQPQIDRPRKEVDLDSSDPQLMKYYKQIAQQSAKKYYSNTIVYGKYRNLSLIDWLRQNTEKKMQE